MESVVEIGKISSRGQIAIPSEIREKMGLEEGTKVLFLLEDDTLLVKRINEQTFAQITKPLKVAAKLAGLREEDVPKIVHRHRGIKE